MKLNRGFAAEKSGQTVIEYALLIGLILFAALGVAAGYGKRVAGVANSVNSNLAVAAASASSDTCRPESNCAPLQHGAGNRKLWVSSEPAR